MVGGSGGKQQQQQTGAETTGQHSRNDQSDDAMGNDGGIKEGAANVQSD
jgi:hypothetical protein